MISGTNGLLGAADGAFVMQKEKRTDNEGSDWRLQGVTSRIRRLTIELDRERCVWNLTKGRNGVVERASRSRFWMQSMRYLDGGTDRSGKGTASELVNAAIAGYAVTGTECAFTRRVEYRVGHAFCSMSMGFSI